MSASSSPKLIPALEQTIVNTIRMLSADMVQKANSGHPGLPLGAAQAVFTLWSQYLRFNPKNPGWEGRDRFILSAGHGSALLYSLLHLTGYGVSLEDIKNFRQWGSPTAGHPEYGHAPGIEVTTGPLGQGFAAGVGMALAAEWLATKFNRPSVSVVDHRIYALVSDGDLMEGIASEAASLAGHLRLGRLIYLYDANDITLDTAADESYTENWQKRFEAYGWHVQTIDGMSGQAVAHALSEACKDPRPSIIGCKTIIGYGSPHKAGTAKAHGEPLGVDELKLTKKNLGWPPEKSFYIPSEVKTYFAGFTKRGAALEREYADLMKRYANKYPQLAQELAHCLSGTLPKGWEKSLPVFKHDVPMATRAASGAVLNKIASVVPNIMGGSADLAGSNKTTIESEGFITAADRSPRNIRFGVREHAMAAMLNGMALHGGVIPYGGTFLVFSDYMRGSMRLAALMGLRVIYVLTHDSIGLGEDGPTHQPIEHIASLRAMPNMTVIRPGDSDEVKEAWKAALNNTKGPTVLALSRQDLPNYDRSQKGFGPATGAQKGAYIFYESNPKKTNIIIIATGSELSIAYQAASELANNNTAVRVVSMPSWELFEKQSDSYRAAVLPVGIPKISIEAGTPFGWERWVGNDLQKGTIIGVNHFGASAPASILYSKFGITTNAVLKAASKLVG